MVDAAQSKPRRGGRLRRPELATQWQLMWWKFKRHHLALIGMSVLAMLVRSEEHTSELQSQAYLVFRLLLEKKK